MSSLHARSRLRTLHRSRNPQEIWKVLLRWSRETLSSVTFRTESRDEYSGSRYWTLVLSSRNYGTFAFYYVFGGTLVPARKLYCVIINKLLHFLFFASQRKTFVWKLITFSIIRNNYVIDFLTTHGRI